MTKNFKICFFRSFLGLAYRRKIIFLKKIIFFHFYMMLLQRKGEKMEKMPKIDFGEIGIVRKFFFRYFFSPNLSNGVKLILTLFKKVVFFTHKTWSLGFFFTFFLCRSLGGCSETFLCTKKNLKIFHFCK